MKRIFTLTMILCFLLSGFSAFADLIVMPESDFHKTHRLECTYVDRNYYTNGPKGYVALYQEPNGRLINYLRNAQCLRIVYTYQDWGLISYINSHSYEKEQWVRMSDLYVIYDDTSFEEEHRAELQNVRYEISVAEGEGKTVKYYQYPGSKESGDFTVSGIPIISDLAYTDPDGRIWIHVGYYCGRRGWVCYSDLNGELPVFGGDPTLKIFENYSSNIVLPEVEPEDVTDEPTVDTSVSEQETVDVDPPLDVPPSEEKPTPENTEPDADEPESLIQEEPLQEEPLQEADTIVYAPETPPVSPDTTMIFIAIGLVAVAVIGAVVLITICYKRKEN